MASSVANIQVHEAIAMVSGPMYNLHHVICSHEPENGADLLSVLRARVLWHREASELRILILANQLLSPPPEISWPVGFFFLGSEKGAPISSRIREYWKGELKWGQRLRQRVLRILESTTR